MERKFGALIPPADSWQGGKTAATIAWVKYLEKQITMTGVPLYVVIEALKSGTLEAKDWPPDGF